MTLVKSKIKTQIKITNDPSAEAQLGQLVSNDILKCGNIYIRRFDPLSILPIKEGKRVFICAKTGAGKSQFLKNIITFIHNKIPVWKFLSPSEQGNHQYGGYFFNDLPIDFELKDEVFKNVKTRQERVHKKWAIPNTSDPVEFKYDPGMAFICDDISTEEKFFKDSKELAWIMTVSRNFHLLLFFLTQRYTLLPVKHRTQFSHVVMFAIDRKADITTLYSEFCSFFDNIQQFKEVYQLCLEDNGCMIIDINVKSMNPSDKVFYFKYIYSKYLPKVKVGSKWFQKWQKDNYDPNWDTKKQALLQEQENIKKLELEHKKYLKNTKLLKMAEKSKKKEIKLQE